MRRFAFLITCLWLVFSLGSIAAGEALVENFVGTWDNVAIEIDYSLTGGDNGQLYTVTATATGCVSAGVPTNLTGPSGSGSVDVTCNTASGTGSVVLRFYKGTAGGTLLRTMVFTFSCSTGCNLTLTDSSEIPTLSEWALIVFGVLLLGLMTYFVLRRRQTPAVGV